MPYDVQWHDDEQTVIRVDMTGKVSWEEWHVVTNQLTDRLSHATGRVDVILNDTVGLPPGNPLPHFKTTMTKLGKFTNMGLMVTVSTVQISKVVKSMLAIAARAYGIPANQANEFTTSISEAEQLIARDRATKSVK